MNMEQKIKDNLSFSEEEGEKLFEDVTLYALSTCGFCKQAIYFLRRNKIQFRFVYVDQLDLDEKKELKSWLKEKYSKSVSFPYLVVDDCNVLVGFKEDEWKNTFSMK